MTRHMIFVALIGAVMVVPAQSAPKKKGTKYALLIGVSDYARNEMEDLKFPARDVIRLGEILVGSGSFQKKYVLILTDDPRVKEWNKNANPTAARIRKALENFAKRCEPEDTLIIAFAGHGVQFRGEKENYFCPADGKLTDRKSLIGLRSEVYRMLDRSCRARVKILLVDACRDDPRTNTARTTAKKRPELDLQDLNRPQNLRAPKSVLAFFSCCAGQKAFECPKLKHGVFFNFVIEALSGKASDIQGRVTLADMKSYVKDNVIKYVTKRLEGVQTPALMEKSHETIVLIEKAQFLKPVNLIVSKVVVSAKKANGKKWDNFLGRYFPDPYVVIQAGEQIKSTPIVQDTCQAQFNTFMPDMVRLGSTLKIVVRDGDFGKVHDLVGETTVKITARDLARGKVVLKFGLVESLEILFRK